MQGGIERMLTMTQVHDIRKTLIINTNIEFSRWVNVFYDEQMTGAMIDRLFHHCHLLLFPGPSNRMRESTLK